MYSSSHRDHNCEVSRQSKKRYKKNCFLKIFAQSNMAARPWDLSIICEYPGIPKAWGTFVWSFPSIYPDVLEKKIFFIGFRVNPIWLLNHVTSDVILWTFCSSWIDGHTCTVSPRSVQPLQRRCLKVLKKTKTIWLPNHVTDDVINFFFCGPFYPSMTLKNFHTDQMWYSTYTIMTS